MTKDNIIMAALRLFLLNGYRNVSLVDVANEVGITKGGIYHYFDSKETLLKVAVYRMVDQFEFKYRELFSRDNCFRDTLHSVIVDREPEMYIEQMLGIQYGDYQANHASLALEVMHTFPEFKHRIDESHLHFMQAIEQNVKAAQAKGEIKPDVDARTLATILLSIFSGQNVLGARLNSCEIRKQVLDSVWDLIGA